jgi:hypothetical protein
VRSKHGGGGHTREDFIKANKHLLKSGSKGSGGKNSKVTFAPEDQSISQQSRTKSMKSNIDGKTMS